MKYFLFAIGGYLCGIMLCIAIPDAAKNASKDIYSLVVATIIAFGFGAIVAYQERSK